MTQKQTSERDWSFGRIIELNHLADELSKKRKLYKLSKENVDKLKEAITGVYKDFKLQSQNYIMCDECAEKISKNGRFKKSEAYCDDCEVCGKPKSSYRKIPRRRLTLQEAKEFINNKGQ